MRRCNLRQPWNRRRCYRPTGHDGEHRSVLTPGRTYCYWTSDSGPVKYRVQTEADKLEIQRSVLGDSE